MRFATVACPGQERVGLVDGDVVRLLPRDKGDLVALVAGGRDALADARRDATASREVVDLVSDQLLAPVRRFSRDVLCTGWNYWAHFEEGVGRRGDQEVDRPERPTFFTKSPDAVTSPYGPIAFDSSISKCWDYEAELALIIGPGGRSIPEAKALDHVWGYLLANDVSQRDLQRAHGGQWLKGKSIDATMPLGPWVVTADEIDPFDVHLECWLNGARVQSASTSQMAFSIPELLAQLSWGMTLRPGDVLLTGTPEGVGNAQDPPVYLAEGDELVVRGSGIGDLKNRVVRTDLTTSTVVDG